ncbi:hypothetical protein UMM65_13815 [Aureibaculum sp. 2210JD6-5]|uniref:hypothetical protein n=1 Tax=Aureibaculum sp. 2210JD6-5 TaxID=3103957 RepID=UPI002AAEB915|nr:hypothetical protein [Aureibaculum sp. 2210JD6-5]MDY7396323.1 hypothetical protein [Aureibaculum sp. 2210JD6-5]
MCKKNILFILMLTFCFTECKHTNAINEVTAMVENGKTTATAETLEINRIHPHLNIYAQGRNNNSYDFGEECGSGISIIVTGSFILNKQ